MAPVCPGLPRVREIVAARGAFPAESSVGAHAIREFDGWDEGENLIRVLTAFDDFIEGLHRHPDQIFPEHLATEMDGISRDVPIPVPTPTPIPEPSPTETPLAVTERYWRTRDPKLLTTNPHARASHDTQLAERVFATATDFLELTGRSEEIIEGVMMSAIIQADRGPWLVLTVLCLDRGEWRVDIPLSIARTTVMFLQEHHIHPPFTETEDARGRAMLFWQQVANHDDRWARELVLPESAEIPRFGDGQIDEFFWYVSHTEDKGTAIVRVLMNTHLHSRTWLTRMIQRNGAWFVDLPAILAG
jgi:hypothetical protein